MKATYQELALFNNVANAWLNRVKDDNKFRYALLRMVNPRNGRVLKLLERRDEDVQDLNYKHGATHADGEKKDTFIYQPNGTHSFTRAGAEAWTKAIRELWATKVDFEPFYAEPPEKVSDTADGKPQLVLTDTERIAFEGFVIPVPMADEQPDSDVAHISEGRMLRKKG